jgi:hypothetical protein
MVQLLVQTWQIRPLAYLPTHRFVSKICPFFVSTLLFLANVLTEPSTAFAWLATMGTKEHHGDRYQQYARLTSKFIRVTVEKSHSQVVQNSMYQKSSFFRASRANSVASWCHFWVLDCAMLFRGDIAQYARYFVQTLRRASGGITRNPVNTLHIRRGTVNRWGNSTDP